MVAYKKIYNVYKGFLEVSISLPTMYVRLNLDFTYQWLMWREEMRRFMRRTEAALAQQRVLQPAEEDGDGEPLLCLSTLVEFDQEELRLHDGAYWNRRVSI